MTYLAPNPPAVRFKAGVLLFGVVGIALTISIVAALVGLPFAGLGFLFLALGVPILVWRYREAQGTVEPVPRSRPCFPATGRRGWLARSPSWAEKCGGLSRTGETAFSGAMQPFEGGWLLL